MSRAALLLAIVAAAGPAACGSRSTAWTNPNFSDAAADAAVMSCDTYLQDCPPGSKCDLVCNGTTATACRPDNDGGAAGSVCSPSMSCAKGTGCLTTADAGSTCMKYCAGDGDCATGQRCHNVDVSLCGGPQNALLQHVCY